MKQPELGKKISELRKARGLTQEELVEKCNIGVRTIQRIEAGEVTPRSYTIKTILAALESDMKLVSEDYDKSGTFTGWLKRLFLIDVDLDEPSTVTIVGLIVLGGFVVYGWFMGTLRFHWHIVIILLIYPVWGLVQQFLMMSLFAGNLKDFESKHFNKTLIVILTSILFSMVHYPSFHLIIATFIMALFYSIVFLSKRNIIPLGIFHGVLGGVFYFVVLNRDPWVEFIELLNK